jgi:hypothetical protein
MLGSKIKCFENPFSVLVSSMSLTFKCDDIKKFPLNIKKRIVVCNQFLQLNNNCKRHFLGAKIGCKRQLFFQ